VKCPEFEGPYNYIISFAKFITTVFFAAMFRFFEKLVDPYQPYPVSNRPPRALLLFLRDYLRPFKKIFGFSIFFSRLLRRSRFF